MAYSLIGHAGADSSDGTTVVVTLTTTGADFLIVTIGSGANLVTADLSSSPSNTWHALTLQSSTAAVNTFYAWNASVGLGQTFTYTLAGSVPSMEVTAWSGSQTASDPFDQQNGSAPGFSTTLQPGSVTPSTANQLVITATVGLFITAPTINSGFTISDWEGLVGGAAYASAQAYLVQTSAAAVNPTWSQSSGMYAATIATFKAAAGGGARGLFRTPPVSGVGIGGSFFRDPLQGRPQPSAFVRKDRIFVPRHVAAGSLLESAA